MAGATAKPGRDCPLCPRLAAFRQHGARASRRWFNAPVPSFGTLDARLLIVGLAPGLRGANRTGRPFTGDYAGDLLYATLKEFGFARGDLRGAARRRRSSWSMRASPTRVRCVPPENKPTAAEIDTCRHFLSPTIAKCRILRAIVALGRIAHDSDRDGAGRQTLSGAVRPRRARADRRAALFSSYHCSRYNTNTGVLTPGCFARSLRQCASTLR